MKLRLDKLTFEIFARLAPDKTTAHVPHHAKHPRYICYISTQKSSRLNCGFDRNLFLFSGTNMTPSTGSRGEIYRGKRAKCNTAISYQESANKVSHFAPAHFTFHTSDPQQQQPAPTEAPASYSPLTPHANVSRSEPILCCLRVQARRRGHICQCV